VDSPISRFISGEGGKYGTGLSRRGVPNFEFEFGNAIFSLGQDTNQKFLSIWGKTIARASPATQLALPNKVNGLAKHQQVPPTVSPGSKQG
jgi:hypothetical protein